MELDEIIYAVGELYLKYRKEQQIRADISKKYSEEVERNVDLQRRVDEAEIDLQNPIEPEQEG